MARLAVYIIPPPDSDLYRLGSAILGYDVFAERDLSRPEALQPLLPDLDDWVGGAPNYGYHATIGDALIYADEEIPEIEAAVAQIAAETAPVQLANGRIHRTFREYPQVLVGTFDSPDRALQRLEDRVVTTINVRHTASPHFAKEVGNYSDLQRENFERYGSPNVRSLFDLHFTLAVRLPDAEAWHLLADTVTSDVGLFSTPDQRGWTVDHLHLLEEKPNGRFRIRHSYPLTGKT
jgi:hypothetical protein